MSDRALWLDEWCPTCRVAPRSRCRTSYLGGTKSPTKLHVARDGGPARARNAGRARRFFLRVDRLPAEAGVPCESYERGVVYPAPGPPVVDCSVA
jgi:hypothetical protein